MLAEALNSELLILSAKGMKYELLFNYWNSLMEAKTLKYRFSDMPHPTPVKIINMINDPMYQMFNIIDAAGVIIADFALETFTGKAAQIHFSMHPDNDSKFSLELTREAARQILDEWKDENGDPYLETLYGLTPVDNRVACIFVLKAGMTKIGILPNGVNYLGKTTDAMLTVLTRN